MSEPSSEKSDLVKWKQYCDGMDADRGSPFNFGDRAHVEKLSESVSNREQRMSLEPSCQKHVNAFADAVSMLDHKLAAHANGPRLTPWGHVVEKQDDVFKALRELVHQAELKASPDTAAWLRLHVFAVLLDPPHPREAVLERFLRLGQDVLSGFTIVLDSVFGTAADVGPSSAEDDGTVNPRGESTLGHFSDLDSVAKSSSTS